MATLGGGIGVEISYVVTETANRSGLVTLTFDLLTLKVVSESRVTWATTVPILVFLRFSVFELGPTYATDRRQTKASLNASALRIRITRLGPSVQSTGQLQHNTTAMAEQQVMTTTTTSPPLLQPSAFVSPPYFFRLRRSPKDERRPDGW